MRGRSLLMRRAAGMALAGILLAAFSVTAAEPTRKKAAPRGNASQAAAEAPAETVALFDALQQNKLAAQVTTFDHTTVRLMLGNRSSQPLQVEIPPAFGAVSAVLAQRMQMQQNVPGILPRASSTSQSPTETPQTLGVWTPPPSLNNQARPNAQQGNPAFPPLGRNGLAQRENLFNVEAPPASSTARPMLSINPQQVVPLMLTGVCLQYGNPTPRPRNPFVIRPLEQTPTKPEVRALLRLVATEDIPRRVAQPAAWHLANGISWDRLLDRTGSGTHQLRFTMAELQAAQQVVQRIQAGDTSAAPGRSGGGSGETPRN